MNFMNCTHLRNLHWNSSVFKSSGLSVIYKQPNCKELNHWGRDKMAAILSKCIFLTENVWISINITLKFVPKGPIESIPSLVQIMAWRRPGDKPLSESMMVSVLTYICVNQLTDGLDASRALYRRVALMFYKHSIDLHKEQPAAVTAFVFILIFGYLFTKLEDVLLIINGRIAMKFDRRPGNSAAKSSVKM